MKTKTIFKSSLFLLAMALLVSALAFRITVSAQEVDQTVSPETTQAEMTAEEPATEEEKSDDSSKDEGSNYNYVAQAGDSYTKMARKAVQTYGINSQTNLSGAQIVFVETNLTNKAGSPVLNLGQNVSISEDDVKDWVSKAQELSESQTALWQVFASHVNFNTDAVGEAR